MIVSFLVPLLVSLVSQIEKSRLEKHTQTRPEGALVFGTPLTLFAWDAVPETGMVNVWKAKQHWAVVGVKSLAAKHSQPCPVQVLFSFNCLPGYLSSFYLRFSKTTVLVC